jgi:hypothetical protein
MTNKTTHNAAAIPMMVPVNFQSVGASVIFIKTKAAYAATKIQDVAKRNEKELKKKKSKPTHLRRNKTINEQNKCMLKIFLM